MCDGEGFIVGMVIAILVLLLLLGCTGNLSNRLSKDTMQDICQKLNPDGPKVFNAYANQDGRLVCEYPSYDNTQNIVFKSNSDGDKR
jgi:outer membrane biogenesis lipoprotein LolB